MNACDCTRGLYGHRKRICAESWLWGEKKNSFPHRGTEPASVACRSDALKPTELHPTSCSEMIFECSFCWLACVVVTCVCKLFTAMYLPPQKKKKKKRRRKKKPVLASGQHVHGCSTCTLQQIRPICRQEQSEWPRSGCVHAGSSNRLHHHLLRQLCPCQTGQRDRRTSAVGMHTTWQNLMCQLWPVQTAVLKEASR